MFTFRGTNLENLEVSALSVSMIVAMRTMPRVWTDRQSEAGESEYKWPNTAAVTNRAVVVDTEAAVAAVDIEALAPDPTVTAVEGEEVVTVLAPSLDTEIATEETVRRETMGEGGAIPGLEAGVVVGITTPAPDRGPGPAAATIGGGIIREADRAHARGTRTERETLSGVAGRTARGRFQSLGPGRRRMTATEKTAGLTLGRPMAPPPRP